MDKTKWMIIAVIALVAIAAFLLTKKDKDNGNNVKVAMPDRADDFIPEDDKLSGGISLKDLGWG